MSTFWASRLLMLLMLRCIHLHTTSTQIEARTYQPHQSVPHASAVSKIFPLLLGVRCSCESGEGGVERPVIAYSSLPQAVPHIAYARHVLARMRQKLNLRRIGKRF
jgi:hypothetical protein